MYIAAYLNSRGLFQRTGGWMVQPGVNSQSRHFAVLLQRASQILFHLEQSEQLKVSATEQFAAHLRNEPSLPESLHAWSPIVSGLIIELSGALAALRVMQNDAWGLISAITGLRDTPTSYREAYTKFVRDYGKGNKKPKWLNGFDEEIRKLLVDYWKYSGGNLADYRDVDQHFDVLARGAIYLPEREGRARLSIQLPDNPEVKSRGRFTYMKSVDASELALSGFRSLHGLIEQIAEIRGAPMRPLQQMWEFNPPIQHQPDVSSITAITLNDVQGEMGFLLGHNENMQVTIKAINL
ncbi:MAG: hypothetical protein ACR65O_02565 [Methylomicrobium sp.]|jgi:hypothetical protein